MQVVENVADLEVDTSTAGTQWGTGGMATKLTAARIACAAGCSMAICNSERPEAIEAILAGERKGTVFRPLGAKMAGAKRWILSGAASTLVCFHLLRVAARCGAVSMLFGASSNTLMFMSASRALCACAATPLV